MNEEDTKLSKTDFQRAKEALDKAKITEVQVLPWAEGQDKHAHDNLSVQENA